MAETTTRARTGGRRTDGPAISGAGEGVNDRMGQIGGGTAAGAAVRSAAARPFTFRSR
jgi:hypothetical protein